jgi:nitrate reductase gamma subunit
MKMFLLGVLTMYLVAGIIILLCNTFDIDEDNKDTIFAWWLMPLVIFKKMLDK